MSTVQEVDARISEAERQIALLSQEIRDLKTARNALAPLAECGSIREALSLTWICRRLRALFEGAPEMWTRIDIFAHDRAAIRCCVGRASPHTLEILVDGGDGDISDEGVSFLLYCLAKAGACYWQFAEAQSITAVSDRLIRDGLIYPMLHKITFNICEAQGDLSSAYQAAFPNLATLNIEDLTHDVPILPGIPTLRTFRLHNSTYPLRVLHAFFFATSSLESIDLNCVLQDDLEDDRAFGLSSGPVHLPKLSRLKIREMPECTALLVHTLPNPSDIIHLTLLRDWSNSDRTRESWSGGLIDRRMRAFWGSLIGSPLKGTVSYVCGNNTDQLQLRFEGANLSHGTCNDYAITSFDPLWKDVQTLELYSLGNREDDIAMQEIITLHHLPNVDTVVVKYLHTESVDNVEDIEYLEGWLLARGEQGHHLQSLVFQDCDEYSRPLFDRLVEGQVALFIVWK